MRPFRLEFETPDLIGFPLLDSNQSSRVFPEPLVSHAPGPTGSGDENGFSTVNIDYGENIS